MIKTIFKTMQKTYYFLVNKCTCLFLKLIGVEVGENLTAFFVTTIEFPQNIKIGNNVWMSKNVAFYGANGITIGNDVVIAKDVSLVSSDHGYKNAIIKINKQGSIPKAPPIKVKDDVWLGEKSIILKSVNNL